ncbi:MAG TPA: FGGY family carbohydrate kinase, partial [Chryseolinea sp.]|nr:FGGY family carbohydrate kinase [Chryseolinea sp.]
MALTIAIDLGTTNLKVGLVNEQGDILSVVSRPLHTYSSEPGAAEHNPDEVTNLLSAMCGELLKDVNKDQIDHIVSSTYQFGMM